MAACWSASEPANQGVQPLAAGSTEANPLRGQETSRRAPKWSIPLPALGVLGSLFFFHQYQLENEIGLSGNPGHHCMTTKLRRVWVIHPMMREGWPASRGQQRTPRKTQCSQTQGPFLGQKQRLDVCDLRHDSWVRFQWFHPYWMKASFMTNWKDWFGLVFFFFFPWLLNAFVGVPSGRRALGYVSGSRFPVVHVGWQEQGSAQCDPRGKVLTILKSTGAPNSSALVWNYRNEYSI